MKEQFVSLAIYNKNVNNIIFEYINNMKEDELAKKIKSFYSNIINNTFHLLSSDLKWLEKFSSIRKNKYTTEILDQFKEKNEFNVKKIYSKKNQVIELRKEVDQMIIDLMNDIDDAMFKKEYEIEFGGKKQKNILWKLLLQWFNHQTHHRGQLSVLLDNLDLSNDYSAILDKI